MENYHSVEEREREIETHRLYVHAHPLVQCNMYTVQRQIFKDLEFFLNFEETIFTDAVNVTPNGFL